MTMMARGKPLPAKMRVPEMAALFGLAVTTVQRWCREKSIPARRVGRQWVVSIRLLKERNEDLYEELSERWNDHHTRSH